MKKSLLLLIVSLAANLVLALALARTSPPAMDAPAQPESAAAARLPPSASVPASIRPPSPPLWPRLRSDNLDELSRRLHAAGFPTREVRAMLAMAINEQTTARREAILGKAEDTPYWKSPPRYSRDPQLQARLTEIYQDERELNYRYVNGPDALAENDDALVAAKRRYGDLSLAKLQQLTALQHDFDETQMKSLFTLGSHQDPAAGRALMETRRTLEKAQFAEISKLLTPAELEQYELRNNAGGMRTYLSAFRPTEEEFKALYAAQKEMSDAASDPTTLPEKRAALYAEYQAKVATLLTPERAADYAELGKGNGDKLPRLMARLDLPLATISQINTVRDDITSRAKTIGADPTLSPAQRQTGLTALAQEAHEKLTATLGTRGYEAYADLKGDWIRALKPTGK